MGNTAFSSILCLLIFTYSSTFYVKADNDNETEVWLTERGEEHSLTSRPLPPMAMKMIQGSEAQENEAVDDDSVVETGRKSKPDEQPDNIWKKTCRAAMTVNEHYKIVESKVDPLEVEEALRQQMTPIRSPECSDKDEDERTVMQECRSCAAQLKSNAFGVQLTCYQCQRGKTDRTCHYIIKVPKRRQLLIIMLTEEEGGKREEKMFTKDSEAMEKDKKLAKDVIWKNVSDIQYQDEEEQDTFVDHEEEEQNTSVDHKEGEQVIPEEKCKDDEEDECKCSVATRVIN